MARAKIPETKLTPKEALGSASGRLVMKLPLFSTLTTKQAEEIISHMRFPNDPRKRRELLSAKSLKLPAGELLMLARADQLLTTLDRLERMEKHYVEVSRLDAKQVQRGLEASDPDDLGALAYKWCLTEEGADPRLRIAERILSLIPIARRNLEAGAPLWYSCGRRWIALIFIPPPRVRRARRIKSQTAQSSSISSPRVCIDLGVGIDV